jgi:hypothetical protein
MGKYNGTDLRLTPDGDLAIERGDLSTVTKQEYISQSARNRIRIADPEWIDYQIDEIGANLEDLIGLPNNPETASMGVDKIGRCLTRDGLLDSDDIYIRPVPISRTVMIFYVFIKIPVSEFESGTLGFEVLFNLENGLTIRSV